MSADLSCFFHEASHTFADTITNALSAEDQDQHKEVGDLWHAVMLYTSGVELRRFAGGSTGKFHALRLPTWGLYGWQLADISARTGSRLASLPGWQN